ncbi:DUF2585 family protein [Phaeovulum sp.]|uniref:DUF2585 family protein n=1 Tax=Phaeovulum sp. TaxID=2934796 RepID=UPI0027309F8B|nr:DUF2585 family protein [Phaeovulum sp.]MDP1668876.1 DUF2585 family protein [Phaeovulum sp.]MDZ4118213.1 DUF2585 family protein [Phaeovulum sp.]
MRMRLVPWAWVVVLMAAAAVAMLLSGRALVCGCGSVRLFSAAAETAEVSQQFTDWYTPSHLVHGLLLYGAAWLALPHLALAWRMVAAVAVEALWEVIENADPIIGRFRAEAAELGAVGDTVLNAEGDILAMVAGFWLARLLPVWASAALAVALELLAFWAIGDGLVLIVLRRILPAAVPGG